MSKPAKSFSYRILESQKDMRAVMGLESQVWPGESVVTDHLLRAISTNGGTYSGKSVGTATGITTLDILETTPVIETINTRGSALMKGIGEILTEADIPHRLPGVPEMFGIVMGVDADPHDFRDYFKGDSDLYEELALELIKRGVQPDGDAREP